MGIVRPKFRAAGLPRARPAPEHNAIQNPVITRGIQRAAGIRQAHVAPGLAEGVQPVISVGDIRDDPRTAWPKSYAAFIEQVSDGANVKRAIFTNPFTSGVICALRRLHVYAAEDYSPGGATSLIYSYAPQSGTVLAPNVITSGVRLVFGYEWHPVGAPPAGPDEALDVPVGEQREISKCGWHTPMINGIDGSYYWRGTFHGEETENFNAPNGPRIFVYPNGTFHAYVIDVNAHLYWNMWWDEYPLRA